MKFVDILNENENFNFQFFASYKHGDITIHDGVDKNGRVVCEIERWVLAEIYSKHGSRGFQLYVDGLVDALEGRTG